MIAQQKGATFAENMSKSSTKRGVVQLATEISTWGDGCTLNSYIIPAIFQFKHNKAGYIKIKDSVIDGKITESQYMSLVLKQSLFH